jgi:hypothetical protein
MGVRPFDPCDRFHPGAIPARVHLLGFGILNPLSSAYETYETSRPDFGWGFQVNVLGTLEVEPSSLGSGSACNRVHHLVR